MIEEMDKLRDSIQTLCKSTNPLARSMDYLQEVFPALSSPLLFLPRPEISSGPLMW